MDIVSHYLNSLKITSSSISKWQLSEPWGVNVTNFSPSYMLTVVSGKPVFVKTKSDSIVLNCGEAFMVPRGGDCTITSEFPKHLSPISELPWVGLTSSGYNIENYNPLPMQVTLEGEGEETILLGIAFQLNDGAGGMVINGLPEFLVFKESESKLLELIKPIIEHLIEDSKLGYYALASQLAELSVVGLLREYILNNKDFPVGPLKGLVDRRLGKVLLSIHNEPAFDWTLDSLASVSNMSRSGFALRFKSDIGIAPMAYLQRLRLSIAKKLLKESKVSVVSVAQSVGFHSDRVFRAAFKKEFGHSPYSYKRLSQHQ